jgi:prepilin-type N-terminal cleavage/methylation domain-containing protein
LLRVPTVKLLYFTQYASDDKFLSVLLSRKFTVSFKENIMWKYNKQSGFTLVELAIVLVIIGLILAAVLKGQEMMSNAKVKNLVNDLHGIQAAYHSYYDRYKALPGDDSLASSHITGGVNGNGDGIITGTYTDANTATESGASWQHMRGAGFLTGSGTLPATNTLGGVLGIESGTTYGMTGSVVCAGSIPWKIAQAVDTILDDGNSDTGTVRSGATSATANAATADGTSSVYGSGVAAVATVDQMHTVCMKL